MINFDIIKINLKFTFNSNISYFKFEFNFNFKCLKVFNSLYFQQIAICLIYPSKILFHFKLISYLLSAMQILCLFIWSAISNNSMLIFGISVSKNHLGLLQTLLLEKRCSAHLSYTFDPMTLCNLLRQSSFLYRQLQEFELQIFTFNCLKIWDWLNSTLGLKEYRIHTLLIKSWAICFSWSQKIVHQQQHKLCRQPDLVYRAKHL